MRIETYKLIESIVRKVIYEGTVYKNAIHGTTIESAKEIDRSGFKLPKRGAIFFDKRSNGNLASVYGSGAFVTADIKSSKSMEMSEVRKVIFPKLKELGIKISEQTVHEYLRKLGYDLILNGNELIVLKPDIINVTDVKVK